MSHSSPAAPSMESLLDTNRPNAQHYEEVYRNLHRDPELSFEESHTASMTAGYLEKMGFTVHQNIGGHGVVGVLENGQGRKVLLRADMDALPVLEATELSYASKKRMQDHNGAERPVMHACGHDIHVVSLLAAAKLLTSAKADWAGTLICLFQPNEELGGGARAMVEDGLYKKVPKPDILFAQHVIPMKSGSVAVRSGPTTSEASTVTIRVYGRGGHGSVPQSCIDPIMIAAYILIRIQSIVSREVNPEEIVVVTCGSFHGGEAANVIPDEVSLGVNVRTYNHSVHTTVLESIRRIALHECEIGRCARQPSIEISEHFLLTSNDNSSTDVLKKSFGEHFGQNLSELPHNTASEDFSTLADAIGAPYVYWGIGGTDASEWKRAEEAGELAKIPGNHSSKFAPAIQPTLKTGMEALSIAALTFLSKAR